MKKLLRLILITLIVVEFASCSGGSSKYPATGDMEKDAKTLVQELLKDNADQAVIDEMAASYENYYRSEGKYAEFEKVCKKVTAEEMSKAFTKAMDEAVDDANKKIDAAAEEANKKIDKAAEEAVEK